ncbi:DNA methyltransferase [Trichormus azollae]|uniref:DNA methyltransferase n=1 Tax=Trichormus azollae TaxID=1164 RepID=UPI0009DA54A4|nr:DNA methyltransferase [Trichormus azollae]
MPHASYFITPCVPPSTFSFFSLTPTYSADTIEYYTNPGDVVLDSFCRSGMTGVAATEVGRKALLSDLSPAAAFIAYNLNTPIDAGLYLNAINGTSTKIKSKSSPNWLYKKETRPDSS